MKEYNNNMETFKMATLQYLSEGINPHNCAFCNRTIYEGYSTLDFKNWICLTCFKDFKDKLNFKVVSQP